MLGGMMMSRICDHAFEAGNPRNRGYSLVEFDLAATSGLTLRKNLYAGRYELANIRTGEVYHAYPRLEDAVRAANQVEQADDIRIGCGILCPRRG